MEVPNPREAAQIISLREDPHAGFVNYADWDPSPPEPHFLITGGRRPSRLWRAAVLRSLYALVHGSSGRFTRTKTSDKPQGMTLGDLFAFLPGDSPSASLIFRGGKLSWSSGLGVGQPA